MKRIVKRRKLNIKRVMLAIITLILFIVGIFLLINKIFFNDIIDEDKKLEDKIIISDIIDNIVNYSSDKVSVEFLKWIENEYGKNVLVKLEHIFSGGYVEYEWRNIIGESYKVLYDRYNGLINDDSNIRIANDGDGFISFVGDVSLADNWYIMPKYDERSKGVYGILSEDVVDIMKKSSVMVANNEFTVSDRGEKMPKKYYTFRGGPNRLSIYDEMGVDLVTLANNHVFDFGKVAFLDTLKYLKEYDIPYIGAGNNLEEAMKPYYFVVNGYKIGFVNAIRAEKFILTPEATSDKPGVLRCYNPDNFIKVIEETKKVSDYVVALVHWGREDSTELEEVQITTSKQYIDAGADLIVGSHAHNLQGIDFYKDKPIIYNLGDFIFNNETKDTAIFQFRIDDDGNIEYYLIPCKESGEYTYLLKDNEKIRVIDFMKRLSPNVVIENSGKFYNH